ncbi:MAG: GFA family protein [Novosphingobium sp.]|nr:GFA family protein [Novosphingobium sp.]
MSKTALAGSEGGCECGNVRYRLEAEPITVNCCHCHACQRQSGSAFAINVLIEPDNVSLLRGKPEAVEYETASGMGHANFRCPDCKVSVWSVYHAAGGGAYFLRAGSLDDPSKVSPNAHIHTAGKLPWVTLPEGAEQFAGFYSGKDILRVFGEDGAARWRKVMQR